MIESRCILFHFSSICHFSNSFFHAKVISSPPLWQLVLLKISYSFLHSKNYDIDLSPPCVLLTTFFHFILYVLLILNTFFTLRIFFNILFHSAKCSAILYCLKILFLQPSTSSSIIVFNFLSALQSLFNIYSSSSNFLSFMFL